MAAAASGAIGRLPTHASNSTAEDNELELLELQLLASTQPTTEIVGPGRFSDRDRNYYSTYPRRRQTCKSLMTLWSDRCLLDELQAEQTRRMLSRITRWDFNAFTLDRLTNGHNLSTLCTHLFHEAGVIRHFRLDILAVWKFFYLVEQGYHNTNPYHNGVHAADVTQAIHCFLQQPALRAHLTPLEFMGAVVAAVCHDLDHPGKNEKFLIATSSHLAGMYNNSSVLENHHWRSALSVLWESGLSDALGAAARSDLHAIVRDMILATDISRQQEFLERLRAEGSELDLSRSEDRLFVLQIAMKCADISNPCRSWNISRLWSYRACEEFYRQGDRERELGLPVTPFCDRYNMSVAKVQAGFYRFVASPLFEEWNNFLSSPLTTSMMHNLTSNQARWDLIVQQEARSNSLMVESAASTSSSSGNGSLPNESRRDSLDPGQHAHYRLSRSSADGDDDSDPCSSYPYLPLDAAAADTSLSASLFARRHSLPLSNTKLNSRTSSEESAEEPNLLLRRQYSLVERRRQCGVRQHSYDSSYHRLAKKRSLFASGRSPIQTLQSESAGSSFENDPEGSHRVTFHFGPEEEDENKNENDKENSYNSHRRGSAPSSLLLGSKAFGASREHSPTSLLKMKNLNRLNLSQRRGSLPSDLLDQDAQLPFLCGQRSSSCGRSHSGGGNKGSTSNGKKRRVLRRKSGGSEMLATSNSSPHQLEDLGSKQQFLRRGSLRAWTSSSSARRGSAPLGMVVAEEKVLDNNKTTTCGLKSNLDLLRELQSLSRVQALRSTTLLSPSVESELIEEVQTSLACLSGRRGSLPTELTAASFVK